MRYLSMNFLYMAYIVYTYCGCLRQIILYTGVVFAFLAMDYKREDDWNA